MELVAIISSVIAFIIAVIAKCVLDLSYYSVLDLGSDNYKFSERVTRLSSLNADSLEQVYREGMELKSLFKIMSNVMTVFYFSVLLVLVIYGSSLIIITVLAVVTLVGTVVIWVVMYKKLSNTISNDLRLYAYVFLLIDTEE